VASVLLTETTKDPAKRNDNYAYRSKDHNSVNGDESRYLDGKPIPPEKKIYSLIDSSPAPDAQFGQAFEIFIPYVTEFGYEWTRSGEIFMKDGTFINVRTFALPYADYRGAFQDNPYKISVTQKPPAPSTSKNYLKDTVENYTRLVGKENVRYSKDANDTISQIAALIEPYQGKDLELVICLDTTESMENDIGPIKKELVPLLRKKAAEFKSLSVGLVLYKDYFEEYLYKPIPLSEELDDIQIAIDRIRPWGGRDIPEAVDEALYAALSEYAWTSEAREIILIGDAPAHPVPQGKIRPEDVTKASADRGVTITAIILPQ
jgi:hypothetical protein